jgi:CRP-like cAMP-binding protein
MSVAVVDDFWSGLAADAAADFTERATVAVYPAGRTLAYTGQVPDHVIVIRSGCVKISVVSRSGREVVLAFRGQGELVGEQSAVDGVPRSATVTAVERVEALVLSHHAFRAFLLDHPDASLLLLRMLSLRLRDADAKRVELSTLTTISRVATRLLELSDRFGGDNGEISLPLSQEELAGSTGASVESVGRALQTMRTLGCIETHRRRLLVLDRTALQALSRAGG